MDELYYSGMGLYEGGLDDQNLVRRVLTDPRNAWALDADGGAYHTYQDTWHRANHYFADKQSKVNQILYTSILGGGILKSFHVSSGVIMAGGVGSTGVGLARNGVPGAVAAASSYGQVVTGVSSCAYAISSCWVTAPVAFDGANDYYKAVIAPTNPALDESSLYAIGSNFVFGNPKPGVVLDYATDGFSFFSSPHRFLDYKNNDLTLEVVGASSGGVGLFSELTSGRLSVKGDADE